VRSGDKRAEPARLASPGGEWFADDQEARVSPGLPSLPQPVPLDVVQVGDGVDLSHRRLHVVLDPAEADGVAIEQDVAGTRIVVSRLAHGADVDEDLAAVEAVAAADLLGGMVSEALGEDPGDVRVARQAAAFD
jgi:hypothetical protein